MEENPPQESVGTTGLDVPAALSGSVSISGSVVTQKIDPSVLIPGERYRYVVTATIGTRREATETLLVVPF